MKEGVFYLFFMMCPMSATSAQDCIHLTDIEGPHTEEKACIQRAQRMTASPNYTLLGTLAFEQEPPFQSKWKCFSEEEVKDYARKYDMMRGASFPVRKKRKRVWSM